MAATPDFSLDLSGKVALVTGASAGLGERIARVLAAQGAKVAIAARRLERLEALTAELGGAERILPIALDVTDAKALIDTVETTERELGPIDFLVNNAGITMAQYATKMSTADIDRLLAINVRAPFILSCEVARRLIARGAAGRIVNIASTSAFEYKGNGAALYATTKGAVVRMTETLAVEWTKFGINVNAIAPGAFESEMLDGMIERVGDVASKLPRKRVMKVSQLDGALLFLLSPSSDAITGSCIRADDGQVFR